MQTMRDQIVARIQRLGEGRAFSAKDFLDIGSRTTYPSAWSRYNLAQRGSFHLLPVRYRMQAIERDYRNMRVMIFGEPPSLDGIMETLGELEKEINT